MSNLLSLGFAETIHINVATDRGNRSQQLKRVQGQIRCENGGKTHKNGKRWTCDFFDQKSVDHLFLRYQVLSARHGYGSPPLLVLLGAIRLSQSGKIHPGQRLRTSNLSTLQNNVPHWSTLAKGQGFHVRSFPGPDYWSYNSPYFFREFFSFSLIQFPISYDILITKKSNYFTSSDPHHDISKQLVDCTFVWSFCHATFAQLTIPIICFTWQVIVHVSLSNSI